VACVGGGSNAMGLFHRFITDESVALVGCEAGGDGVETGRHAAPLTAGTPGVLHGARSYLMQDDDGQTLDTTSISAGLDYPGVGPEHSWLRDAGRAQYRGVTDADAMSALETLAKTEGILCAIETAHAFAGAIAWIREQEADDQVVIVNCSGRGDKDVDTAATWFQLT
jgi:tryptophan synthase beta chain